MISSKVAVDIASDSKLFRKLVGTSEDTNRQIQKLSSIGKDQKDMLLRTMADNLNASTPEVTTAFQGMLRALAEGRVGEAFDAVKRLLPNQAAMKETSLGTAIMAKGWEKPVIFPKDGGFKWLGWVDDTKQITTKGLWESAYGEQPGVIIGAVGNSNIKPEQVKGGCSLTKKELSAKYEQSIKEFFDPIMRYFKELGVKQKDIGFAFAHSDCGVDRAAREVVEAHGLKGFATTPTEYTQYARVAREIPPSQEFPKGAVLLDCPYPTALTRNIGQIEDYADVYSRLVGKDNPIGIFGGGEHAFIHDTREALIDRNGSQWVPVDIMRDKHGIVIPAQNENGTVTNAARNILERVNGSPYEQYRYAFDHYVPSNAVKDDIKQYDPQMAVTTIMHSNLSKAGKIPPQ